MGAPWAEGWERGSKPSSVMGELILQSVSWAAAQGLQDSPPSGSLTLGVAVSLPAAGSSG